MLSRIAMVIALVLAAGAVRAQPSDSPPKQEAAACEPGFALRSGLQGTRHDFRCRTRVIDCPERQGHYATVVPDKPLDLAAGVQFSYRCQYFSRDR